MIESELITFLRAFKGRLPAQEYIENENVIGAGEPALGIALLCSNLLASQIRISREQYSYLTEMITNFRVDDEIGDEASLSKQLLTLVDANPKPVR